MVVVVGTPIYLVLSHPIVVLYSSFCVNFCHFPTRSLVLGRLLLHRDYLRIVLGGID